MPSQISQHDREHMQELLAGYGDWFSAHLLRLIAKCDKDNLETLRSVYPDHVEAYEQWKGNSNPVMPTWDPEYGFGPKPGERGDVLA